MRGFGSDNHSGIHPTMLQALINCNQDHAPSYGTDVWTHEAEKLFRQEFGEIAQVFFVFNGTAANALSMRALLSPHHAILCSDYSHLSGDECGAPEFFAGCKLIQLSSQDGKINLSTLKESLIRRGDQHFSQARVLSLTQPTELGTCYSLEELREMIDWAHAQGLYVHIDGARLGNAAYFLGVSLAELTTKLQVDVLSFGGTKNGFMAGEAILFLNPKLAGEFQYIRKQCAQLPSKSRFIAAQFSAYLKDQKWREIAAHSCQMAEKLYQGLRTVPGIQILRPRQSNAVFAQIPQPWVKTLRQDYFFYVWDEKTFECRLMTSWDTRNEDIESFVHLAHSLSQKSELKI